MNRSYTNVGGWPAMKIHEYANGDLFNKLPEELRNSPNNGAIDGFPVKVFINGVYNGLYNWTIPKCDWMFGMNSKNGDIYHPVL